MSVRTDILANVATVLGNVSGIGTVTIGKHNETDADELTLPAAFADFGNDRPAEVGMGFEGFVVPLDVEVWCHDADRESLLALVHGGMLTDETRGGYALNTTRTTARALQVDPGRSLSGFIVSFDILYRHPRGTP